MIPGIGLGGGGLSASSSAGMTALGFGDIGGSTYTQGIKPEVLIYSVAGVAALALVAFIAKKK